MSYKSHRIGPDRVFDHLYDPLYITSGAKDIWKENHNSLYRSAPVRIYPQYGTMFTDLPRRPRNVYTQQRNPLPHFPFIDEGGNQNNAKIDRKCRTAIIGGRDRAKFFNIPLTNETNLQMDIKPEHMCCKQEEFLTTPPELFRTVACETEYRYANLIRQLNTYIKRMNFLFLQRTVCANKTMDARHCGRRKVC